MIDLTTANGEARAYSWWVWPTLVAAIAATGVLPEETVRLMGYNAGFDDETEALVQAVVSPDEAARLADALEATESDPAVVPPRMMESFASTIEAWGLDGKANAYIPTREDLGNLAKFIRQSGGFAVW